MEQVTQVNDAMVCNMALRSAVFAVLRECEVGEDCFAAVASITHTAMQNTRTNDQAKDEEIARLREALEAIESLCDEEITARFITPHKSDGAGKRAMASSALYTMLQMPRYLARKALGAPNA